MKRRQENQLWVRKPHIGSEVNLLSSYLPWQWNDVKFTVYEVIHICTAVVDESEESSSQYIFQVKQLERRSLKKIQGLNGIWTRALRDTIAMLYQLSFEATHWERGQFIEFISARAVKWSSVKFIWNNYFI